jgi:hypothetical protein
MITSLSVGVYMVLTWYQHCNNIAAYIRFYDHKLINLVFTLYQHSINMVSTWYQHCNNTAVINAYIAANIRFYDHKFINWCLIIDTMALA